LRIGGKLQGGYLVIDDTVINKSFAKSIEKLAWIFCSKENRAVLGLNLVVLVWSNGTTTLPLAVKIWKKGGKSKYDLALELLAYAKNILCLQPDYVAFDSWYASKKILKRLNTYKWTFFSQLKKNRKFNGVQLQKFRRHPYWIEQGKIFDDLPVLVVRHGKKHFVTNNLSLSRKEVLALYKTRWVIETMFRILYSRLGLEDCQSISLRAQTAHIHLTMMTLVLLEKAREETGKTEYEMRRECIFYPEKAENLLTTVLLAGA
jgi:putative transposase